MKSITNTEEIRKEIEELARDKFGEDFIDICFEHGQWFVIVYGDDGKPDRGFGHTNYSVVDCAHGCGYGKTDIGFEEL